MIKLKVSQKILVHMMFNMESKLSKVSNHDRAFVNFANSCSARPPEGESVSSYFNLILININPY